MDKTSSQIEGKGIVKDLICYCFDYSVDDINQDYLANGQTKSEVATRHFTAGITGHFSAFHIDFLRVKRYLGYSTIGLYSYPFRLEIIAFLRRDLQ